MHNQSKWKEFKDAVSVGNISITVDLIEAMDNINRHDEDDGCTALILATINQNTVIVDTLLSAGADVFITDNYEWNAIRLAAKIGDISIFSILMRACIATNDYRNYYQEAYAA
eukprot:CAMPEP_0182425206 /NCGR_PEP_ID=MMETSP1167-20130531/11555_1 /TAXON_ID=2988 /ORGANISM="Mallomonas Sp, Strain CCMP3275" /LENGTH=112 /DNA_ID=CAMNT_0024605667 /DNA_START=229 /DNA_END=563 /DNA_ORIENTATION=-